MKDEIQRRDFATALALALLGGATITVSGCGGGGSGYGGGGNPTGPSAGGNGDYGPGGDVDPGGGEVGQISANHSHRALITRADLNAGNGLSLDIQGMATHTHSVELSAAELVSIRDGARVSKGSSATEAHQHTVTFN